jgi:hypothetical protein
VHGRAYGDRSAGNPLPDGVSRSDNVRGRLSAATHRNGRLRAAFLLSPLASPLQVEIRSMLTDDGKHLEMKSSDATHVTALEKARPKLVDPT